MVLCESPPATTITGWGGTPGGPGGWVTLTVTVAESVWPFALVAIQVYVVSTVGNTTKVGFGGRNRMLAMVIVLAPEVLHCKVTRVPGAGDGLGVAVNDNTFGGGTALT